MTLSPDSNLAAMIASRICHDLISPLGAIGNGVELLSLTGADAGPEITLIGESATNANARLRFFRIAFGAAISAQPVNRAEILSILSDLSAGGRVSYTWANPGDCRRPEAKLIFLSLLCLDTALAFGGQVAIHHAAGGTRVIATAKKFADDPVLWARLDGGTTTDTDLSSAHVQFLLLPAELARQGRTASVITTDDTLTISF